jgi:hypothetical protein
VITVIPAASVVTADGEYLYIDGEPCCPLCLEDAGSDWCHCIRSLAIAEADRRETSHG